MYFSYQRKPRRSIKNGTYCESCKRIGSVRRTLKTRKERVDAIVGIAADFWPKWRAIPRYGKRSEWVASRVSKFTATKLRYRQRVIKGKWVTQHRAEIEAEVHRRDHATRKS